MAIDFTSLNLEDLINESLSTQSEQEKQAFQQSEDYQQYKVTQTKAGTTNAQGKTIQEILGLSSSKKGLIKSFNCIKCIDLDVDMCQEIVDRSPILDNLVEVGTQIYPAFKYLHQDIFLSLYKYSVEIEESYNMHDSVMLNKKIMEILVNTPDFINIRRNCRLDQFNSALGSEIIGQKAIEILENIMEKMKDQEKKMEKLKELIKKEQEIDDLVTEQKNLEELIENMKQSGGSNSSEVQDLQDMIDQNALSIEEAKKVANKLAKASDDIVGDDASDDLAKQFTETIGQSLNETSNEITKVDKTLEAWGLDDGGEGNNISFENKREALEQIRRSNKLTKLTDIIGKFKECAMKTQRNKVPNGAQSIKSVQTGAKITDILPSEKINLTHSATKKDFYRRYSQKQLLQYEKESFENKNKGPIIACIDTSGSMSGQQEIWSKAFAIAVMEIAQIQKRDFAAILYSSGADEPIVIEKGELNPQKIFTVSERFSGGGTSFSAPLDKAMKLIENSKFKKSDIIFITDGESYLSEEYIKKFKKLKEEKDFKCIGVLVNSGGRTSDSSLKEFCDDVKYISDIRSLKNGLSEENKQVFNCL